MPSSKTFITLSILLLFSLVNAHTLDQETGIPCNHDTVEFNPDVMDVDESFPDSKERTLLTLDGYPNLRIYTHYDSLGEEEDNTFRTYIENELMPPVVSLLQAALRIKYPLSTPLKLTPQTICNIPTPTVLNTTGVNADFVIVLKSDNTSGTSWVASATNCLVTSGVRRPLVASLLLNSAAIKPNTAETNPMGHEYNMYVLMHEIFHGLGFSKNFFYSYIDAEGNLLKNHIKTVLLAGTNRTVVDLPPLTERLRKFYGCPTLEGAFMEDDGGSGTSGSHWERRFFPFDLLSSGAIHGRKITEFTLAYLEGTGWYVPDYTYAEPFSFGQGAGCDFIYTPCNSTATSSPFEEYCVGSGRECTQLRDGGGLCQTDSCTDGCRFVSPQKEYHCENPSGVYYTSLPSIQVFGRGTGSKCFSGNITTTTKTVSKTTYCFTYNCVGEGLNTTLEVTIGANKAICEREGGISVRGYKGLINCPDPLLFCSTVGKKYCPRGCMARGQCVEGKCVCDAGFKGVDCGFRDI